MEIKIRHLEMIQAVINRMAANSFALKGWAVTLVAGIFALAVKDADKTYFLVAYIPILVFWGIDSYYLLQEKRYRDLYNNIRQKEPEEIDFCMKLQEKSKNSENERDYIFCCLSRTELWFYVPLAIVSAVIILIT
ncbi:MAG: hypothetical protein Q4A83_06510 [Bacillota bacterium]|nr:hypothetical protein [Bacillota bacterium]